MEEIVNKVAQSGLVTINLEDFYDTTECRVMDLKENLFQGLILREKDFRAFVKDHDWNQYEGKNVCLICTADAIVPTWAFMLAANKLRPHANRVFYGTPEQLQQQIIQEKIDELNPEDYRDGKIVIKGCSKFDVPIGSYVALTEKLTPVVRSIMYGEPCSTVPIYKRK